MTQVLGNHERFSISYPELINDVEVGGHILLDDGLVDLEILELDHENGEIVTKVLNEGVLKNKKGVNVPGASINLPVLQRKMKRIFALVFHKISTISSQVSYDVLAMC